MDYAPRMRARLLAAIASGGLLAPAGCEHQHPSAVQPEAPRPVDVAPPPAQHVDAGPPAPDVVTAAPDVAPDVTPDVTPDVAPTETPTANNASPRPHCAQPVQHCFTRGEMQAATGNHGLRAPGAPVIPPPTPRAAANGCFESRFISDGCCNRAQSTPWRQGSRCCYWICEGGCCGRPFEVDRRARTAPPARSTDWLAPLDALALDALDPTTRRALADAWRADAAMEHASVASFARFTLHLMAAGAPSALVEDAQRASLDEVRHATTCYALAAQFDGVARGPGPLDVSGARLDVSLADAVRAAVREGCVGETVSACIARAQADGATDPTVRRALAAIADDEARHAELAWRFVAWALKTDPALGVVIDAAFASTRVDGIAESAAPPAHVDDAAWRAFGRLGRDEARAVAAEAHDEVVRVCAAALR